MARTVISGDYSLETKLLDCRPEVQAAVVAFVRRVAADYSDKVLSITLYGSQARRDADAESDIDLFIVVQQDTLALRQALADLAWEVQFEHDVVISDVVRSAEQLTQMQAQWFPYYQSVDREGISLWKNTSELMPAYA